MNRLSAHSQVEGGAPAIPSLARHSPATDPRTGGWRPLFVLDFEASGLGEFTYPIEIGIARCLDGMALETWSTLIRPPEPWRRYGLWYPESEKVHGLRRIDLVTGIPPRRALLEANSFAGNAVVYCDGGIHDLWWLHVLVHAAGAPPTFALTNWEAAFSGAPEQLLKASAWRREQPTPHRAGPDAELLLRAMLHGVVDEVPSTSPVLKLEDEDASCYG